MWKTCMILAVMLSFVYAPAVYAAPNYQEGLWEITTTAEMPGMPKEMKRPFKHTVCMTKENAVPQPKEKGERKCEMTKQRMEGNKVFWTMTCKDGTVSNGEIAYSKTSFDGSQTTTTNRGGKQTTMRSTMTGKYIGPCKK